MRRRTLTPVERFRATATRNARTALRQIKVWQRRLNTAERCIKGWTRRYNRATDQMGWTDQQFEVLQTRMRSAARVRAIKHRLLNS